MTRKNKIAKSIRGWLPKSTSFPLQNTNKVNTDSSFTKTTISALSSLAFVALSVTIGFSLSTGRDFRFMLILGTLLFAVPFGYSVYRTYLSIVGFVAFGLMLLVSITAGVSIVNTMLFSLSVCVGVALIVALTSKLRKKCWTQVTPKKYTENRIQGWFPKEQSLRCLPKSKSSSFKIRRDMTEWERKAFKINSIANPIAIAVFLGIHLLIDPSSNITELISWSLFLPTVILVNFLPYLHFKKQAKSDRRTKT
jgi:hypothetical protein